VAGVLRSVTALVSASSVSVRAAYS